MDTAAVAIVYQKRLLAKVLARRAASGVAVSAAPPQQPLSPPVTAEGSIGATSAGAPLTTPSSPTPPPRLVRRVSLGGFALIDDDDFRGALAQLSGGGARPEITGSPSGALATQAGGHACDGMPHEVIPDLRDRAPEQSRDADAPFWAAGRQLDVSEWLVEERDTFAEQPLDEAVLAPNPAPPPTSAALPPPNDIMYPEGNSAQRRRIELALLRNEIGAAQELIEDERRLRALVDTPLFRDAMRAAGVMASSLLPRTDTSDDDVDEDDADEDATPLPASGAGDSPTAPPPTSLDRVKKLALALTEYRCLVTRARVAYAEEARAAAARARGASAVPASARTPAGRPRPIGGAPLPGGAPASGALRRRGSWDSTSALVGGSGTQSASSRAQPRVLLGAAPAPATAAGMMGGERAAAAGAAAARRTAVDSGASGNAAPSAQAACDTAGVSATAWAEAGGVSPHGSARLQSEVAVLAAPPPRRAPPPLWRSQTERPADIALATAGGASAAPLGGVRRPAPLLRRRSSTGIGGTGNMHT